ncbi:hypothetical protein [Streptomyces sp. NPDC101455]|uniref:hypothetical protein n=1 Tax=Streptomyces sp. NPDC101455 TaxID=3366142 RepID=UPI0037FD8838
MPKGQPEPFRDSATAEIVERVRARFERAGDDDLELFPAPEDLYGVLVYAREHEGVLQKVVDRLAAIPRPSRDEEESCAAALKAVEENNLDRLRLVRRMRQLVDVVEAAVLRACFDSALKGRELGSVLGIDSRGGAALRLRRLEMAIKSGWEVRTPRLVKEREAAKAVEEGKVASGHPLVRQAALDLVGVRSAFPVIEDLDEWWNDLAEFLDGNDGTPSERASMRTHLRVVLTDLRDHAEEHGVLVTTDERALRIFEAAVAAAWSE